MFRPQNHVQGKIFRTFRESFSNFSPSRKFFRRPKFFAKFSWQRCDSFGPKIVKIGAILTVFRPFEISRKFCPVRAPSKFAMRIQNRNGHKSLFSFVTFVTSWNELRECQKIWGGLCILYCNYRGGFAPRMSAVQNTQAPSEFMTTSISKQKP